MIDADTHLHPQALKLLVARMSRSPLVAAVAGAPHVTNRGRLLLAMQVLEAAAIIGLIRRTQSLTGRVGVVAGVLGLFRRDRVLAVGGYDAADGDRGHRPDLEAAARRVGDRLRAARARRHAGPVDAAALWAQRTRWARGQGEVLHAHLGDVSRWRNHRMWLLSTRVVGIAAVGHRARRVARDGRARRRAERARPFGFAFAWGIAIAAVATVQLLVALRLEHGYDPTMPAGFLLAAAVPPRLLDRSAPRRRSALRPSRSCGGPGDGASSGTSPANGSKQGSDPSRRPRRPTIADDTTSRYHPPSLALWAKSDSGRCAR